MGAPVSTTIRDSITAQKDSVGGIIGNITLEAIDDSDEELGNVIIECKSHYFSQGQKFGHLGVILGQEQTITIYGDPLYTYADGFSSQVMWEEWGVSTTDLWLGDFIRTYTS